MEVRLIPINFRMIKGANESLILTNKHLYDKATLERFEKEKHIRDDVVIYIEPGVYTVPFLIEKALGEKKIRDYFEEELIQSWHNYGKVTIKNNINVSLTGSVRGLDDEKIKLKQALIYKGSGLIS
jgi:hypothetical protein